MDVLWVCYELCACCDFVQMKTAIRKVQLADQSNIGIFKITIKNLHRKDILTTD